VLDVVDESEVAGGAVGAKRDWMAWMRLWMSLIELLTASIEGALIAASRTDP
jgi:hypothetical protein